MNGVQKTILWAATLSIALMIGLKTSTTYRLSEALKPGGPEVGDTSLFLYGSLVLSSSDAGNLHFLLQFGEHKYQLIAAILLVSVTAFVTARK